MSSVGRRPFAEAALKLPHLRSGLACSCVATAASAAFLLGAAAGLAAEVKPSIVAEPKLSPGFDPRFSDYVSRCAPGKPLRFRVDAPSGVTIRMGDGGSARSGKFTAEVPLAAGQATDLVVRSNGHQRRQHVRCLPPDFPRWKFRRFARSQAQWFLLAPVAGGEGAPWSHYVTIIDGRGTPVWWRREPAIPFNSILLPNGQLAWGRWYFARFGMDDAGAWEIHRLDGSLVRTLRTIGSPTDMHDMQPLPNGNLLLVTYPLRRGVDLRPFGGPANAAVFDGELQELSKSGKVVWSWNSKHHIELSENVHWRFEPDTDYDGVGAWDYFHLNSVEPDGRGLVISTRHVDAVYRIDRKTGDVTWKLGGTQRPESLKVVGDTRPTLFSGQHDARLLPDGTLTVFDNYTPGDPRAVRFRIDPAKIRATVLEQVSEPSLTWSPAEGSARRLAGGDWVICWGATHLLSEVTSSDHRVWRLQLRKGKNYRVTPIPYGRLTPDRLRRAMDRMYERGAS